MNLWLHFFLPDKWIFCFYLGEALFSICLQYEYYSSCPLFMYIVPCPIYWKLDKGYMIWSRQNVQNDDNDKLKGLEINELCFTILYYTTSKNIHNMIYMIPYWFSIRRDKAPFNRKNKLEEIMYKLKINFCAKY